MIPPDSKYMVNFISINSLNIYISQILYKPNGLNLNACQLSSIHWWHCLHDEFTLPLSLHVSVCGGFRCVACVILWRVSVCGVCQYVVCVGMQLVSVCGMGQYVERVSMRRMSVCGVSMCGVCQCVTGVGMRCVSVYGVCQCVARVSV